MAFKNNFSFKNFKTFVLSILNARVLKSSRFICKAKYHWGIKTTCNDVLLQFSKEKQGSVISDVVERECKFTREHPI